MKRLLKNYKELDVIYNTGNRGDGVINEGCKQLLSDMNITIGRSDVALFIGAGGFSKGYKHNIGRVLKEVLKYRKIIVASASFDTDDNDVRNFLINLPKNVWLVCREKESFNQCSKLTNQVTLCDDFAFYFNYEPYKKQGVGTLNSFRQDLERTSIKIPDDNKDVSVGKEDDWDSFVKEIAEYNIVHTNRLHVGIVATMLGKQVFLYPNSYHKNRAVYEHSLAKYENCTFVDTKFVCVGNAKTATTSLQSAFNQLGFKTNGYHYNLVAEYLNGNEDMILDSVKNYDFVKDHPYYELYKKIDKLYKCKFILTLRDENEWVKSYRNAIAKQIYNLNETLRQKTYGFYALDQTDEFLIENIYRKNNRDVLEYFKDRPNDLLIIDITRGDGWDKLCPFIGVDVPNKPFPHSNKKVD